MGLDCYWLVERGVWPEGLDDLRLCGGLFSEHGQGSFRGKVYAELIEEISHISLYQEYLPNRDVRVIADALESTEYQERWGEGKYELPWAWYNYRVTRDEYEDLRRMFRAYADVGAALVGWW